MLVLVQGRACVRRSRRAAHGGGREVVTGGTVETPNDEKYQFRPELTVLRGGKTQVRGRRRGRRTRTAAELVLDTRMHTAAVRVESFLGTVPSMGWQQVRCDTQHPHRVMARRIVEAHAARVPLDRVLAWVDTLRAWAVQLYDTRGETVTEHVALFQSARPDGRPVRVA
jgi:hypothetical protein